MWSSRRAVKRARFTAIDNEVLRARRARWREDPAGILRFNDDVLRLQLSPDQRDVLVSFASLPFLRKPGTGKKLYGVTCRGGRGSGKTVPLAAALIWKLVSFDLALCIATAPKERQLFDILWTKVKGLIDRSRLLPHLLDWSATRIGVRGQTEEWQAVARVAAHPENIQGAHRRHMGIFIEEGSGVGDAIFKGLAGGCTEHDNFVYANSNPTKPFGWFYDSHTKDIAHWLARHISAERSPWADKANQQLQLETYGPESPEYMIHVKGEFPPQSEHSLINRLWLVAAANRTPLFDGAGAIDVGLDPARFGSDVSAVVAKSGTDLLGMKTWGGLDGIRLAGNVEAWLRDVVVPREQAVLEARCSRRREILRARGDEEAADRIHTPRVWVRRINIDEIGIGSSALDQLQEDQWEAMQKAGRAGQPRHVLSECDVVGVNVGMTAVDEDLYASLRDEVWGQLRDRLRVGAMAVRPEFDKHEWQELVRDLIPVEYSYHRKGRFAVDDKDAMRKKTGRSPDRADALNLAFFEEGVGFIGGEQAAA
jgi:hypothetical protein